MTILLPTSDMFLSMAVSLAYTYRSVGFSTGIERRHVQNSVQSQAGVLALEVKHETKRKNCARNLEPVRQ
jgi:hypothetical protein